MEFSCNTKIIMGPGTVEQLYQLNSKRLFLVSDPFFAKNGTAQRMITISKAENAMVYDQVKPDPTVQQVAEGTAALREFAPDTVVALGGGSAMDCAKAMVYFSGLCVSFVAIPTTSGSGSEVTDFSILTHSGIKHPLIDEKLRPQLAILDSDLLMELPPKLIADTGFDVLSHALEGYVASGSNPITDALAEKAFSLAMQFLERSYAEDKSVRQQMHIASTMAGMAFTQAGLGLCHAMAHAMGGLYHVPHGRLNAILLPVVVGVNAASAGEKYAAIARLAGLGAAADTVAVRNLKNALIRLRKQLGLPATLVQAGVDPNLLKSTVLNVVNATLADPCCKTNPVPVDKNLIQKVLEEVTQSG